MKGSIQAVGSSLETLTRHYEAVTHNLANASTAGFKRTVRSQGQNFAALMTEAARRAASNAKTVSDRSAIDFTQGSLVHTGRTLDLALQGENAFFVIETPDGPLYTRNGVFQLSAQGQLVNSAGQNVGGEGGPIIIPPDAAETQLTISGDGQILAGDRSLGKLKIVEFEDPTVLRQIGANAYQAPETVDPSPPGEATVHQGFQEASNVSTVTELVDLITVTRLYEANLKTIQSQEDRMDSLTRVAMS